MKKLFLLFAFSFTSLTLLLAQSASSNNDMQAATTPQFGVVNLSVCNMREEPKFWSEMVTQALLGMPVCVLDRQDWIKIQTPDNYVGWVHRTAIVLMDSIQLNQWNKAEKVIVTSHYGFVYSAASDKSATIGDMVAGDRFKWLSTKKGFYQVEYPNGKVGWISRKEAQKESEWRKLLRQDEASILETAYTLLGVPYLWGGTSSKGMDCSGYVRTVLYMHDIIIPRDASQQAKIGQYIEIADDYSNLSPGDLVFFGRKTTAESPERVSHVGIYIGNGNFIHSQGYIHISSLLPNDENFDAFNLNRLLYVRRVLPFINKDPEVQTTLTNTLYQK